MIYEATKGQSVDRAAVSAIKGDCDKFVHNDWLYEVRVECKRTGEFKELPPASPSE